jgi:hypothetical protein
VPRGAGNEKVALSSRPAPRIRVAWAAGDRIGALRIAARFFDRSDATKAFKRGIDALGAICPAYC